MVLDRSVSFSDADLNFGGQQAPRSAVNSGPAPADASKGSAPGVRRRWPW
jgi:hypothetical protein